MANCAFCNVIADTSQVDAVYEDDAVMAFLHIAPLHKGHMLVIPKAHHHSITTVPGALLQRLMTVAGAVGTAAMRATGAGGFNLLVANGSCAGQMVPHVHVQVIPRSADDGLAPPPRSVSYESDAEKSEMLDALRRRLRI